MFTWLGIFSALKNEARPPNGLLTPETFVTKLVGDVPAVAVMELILVFFFNLFSHRAFNLFLEYLNE